MNQHLEKLKSLPGVEHRSGKFHLSSAALQSVGLRYDEIESQAYGEETNAESMLGDVVNQQMQMLEKLQPMIDKVLNDKTDPRSDTLRSVLDMLGGMPAIKGIKDLQAGAAKSDSAPNTLPELPPTEPASVNDEEDDGGIEFELVSESESSIDSVQWLLQNATRLLPGILESAKYAYQRLSEEPLDDHERAVYIVESPSEQDLLDRVRLSFIEVFPDRHYILSFETPCSHLDEHGMYAVFKESSLLGCGEYDEIAELHDTLADLQH